MKGLDEGDVASAGDAMNGDRTSEVCRNTVEDARPVSEPEPDPAAGSRVTRLRYRGICEVCGIELRNPVDHGHRFRMIPDTGSD